MFLVFLVCYYDKLVVLRDILIYTYTPYQFCILRKGVGIS